MYDRKKCLSHLDLLTSLESSSKTMSENTGRTEKCNFATKARGAMLMDEKYGSSRPTTSAGDDEFNTDTFFHKLFEPSKEGFSVDQEQTDIIVGDSDDMSSEMSNGCSMTVASRISTDPSSGKLDNLMNQPEQPVICYNSHSPLTSSDPAYGFDIDCQRSDSLMANSTTPTRLITTEASSNHYDKNNPAQTPELSFYRSKSKDHNRSTLKESRGRPESYVTHEHDEVCSTALDQRAFQPNASYRFADHHIDTITSPSDDTKNIDALNQRSHKGHSLSQSMINFDRRQHTRGLFESDHGRLDMINQDPTSSEFNNLGQSIIAFNHHHSNRAQTHLFGNFSSNSNDTNLLQTQKQGMEFADKTSSENIYSPRSITAHYAPTLIASTSSETNQNLFDRSVGDKLHSNYMPSFNHISAPKRRNKFPFFASGFQTSSSTGSRHEQGTFITSSITNNGCTSDRFSRKVFVGGLPPDIDEEEIKASFCRFGALVVDWPHKAESKSYFPPKGYAFLLFHEESSVQTLIDACFQEEDKLYLCVSSPTIKDKPVQIRPWRLSDTDFVLDSTRALDPRKTVFVGGVPRPLKASELANIMNNLYGGVCYAGIDTDPDLKYPKGAGRVAFSNYQSYITAISARFVHIHHCDIEKRVEVKPYVLDDQFCDECQGSRCANKFAPFFCANITCLRYYCDSCWATVHSVSGREFHKPLVKEGGDRPRGAQSLR